ncbi:HSP20-like chaperone [Fennellomyces sp. T-0311]|nr:HSP20-like chaperone [Fennellomyces sp. T-0311]
MSIPSLAIADRSFQNEVDYFFNSLYSDIYYTSPSRKSSKGTKRPLVNIYENDGEWILRAEFPGVKKEDITVKVTQKYIVISAESKFGQKYAKESLRYQESYERTYNRQLPIPANIDHENIAAKFDNGILEVTFPKDPNQTKYNRVIVLD